MYTINHQCVSAFSVVSLSPLDVDPQINYRQFLFLCSSATVADWLAGTSHCSIDLLAFHNGALAEIRMAAAAATHWLDLGEEI